MPWKSQFSETLKTQFEFRRAHDVKFSVRKFAKELRLSRTTLSEVLRNKKGWKMTRERAVATAKLMRLSVTESNRLLEVLGEGPRPARREVADQNNDFLTNWLLLPILICHEIPDERFQDADFLARRFGLDPKKVRSVIRDLEKRGFLKKNGLTRRLERTSEPMRAGDLPIPSEVVREHHRSNLKIARQALETIPAPKRDFTSLTFAGNSRRLEEIRLEIRSLHERVLNLMDEEAGASQQNDEVYRLSINLFPLNFNHEESP